MLELTPEQAEQYASMSAAERTAFRARYEPPDTAEQVRTAAAKHIPADQLDSIMGIVDASKFVTDGTVDEAKVSEHFGRLFGAQQQPHQWGQRTGFPSSEGPGETGRAALKRRWGVGADQDQPAAGGQIAPGRRGREALALRHPKADRR